MIRAGARIVNAHGVPGTLGCVAHSLSNRAPVLLTAHHVLFGEGARAQDSLWCDDTGGLAERVGVALYGRFGIVEHEGSRVHIDCAVASLDEKFACAPSAPMGVTHYARATVGDRVTKLGAASGLTTGIVIDVALDDAVLIDGRSHLAPCQLLIRSTQSRAPFSASGDSGALILNAHGQPVGMLTGVTAAGDSIACHIAPVLSILHLRIG